MPRRQCYHCKQWIDEDQEHDCWTTTEAALTHDLTEDLRDAWERLRETAAGFWRSADLRLAPFDHVLAPGVLVFCPTETEKWLELCVFLGREVRAPQMRRTGRASKAKVFHTIRITHRDEVEPPLTDWLREAYEFSAAPAPKAAVRPQRHARTATKPVLPPEDRTRKASGHSGAAKQKTDRSAFNERTDVSRTAKNARKHRQKT